MVRGLGFRGVGFRVVRGLGLKIQALGLAVYLEAQVDMTKL